MHIAVTQTHVRDAQADGFVHGGGAAALKQGSSLVVAQHARRKMQQEFIHQTGLQQRRAQLAAADARLAAMSGLLDELFSYARAADPDAPLELGSVALRPLLEQVLLGHYPEFEERGWEPTLECEDVMVEADAETLARIAENLVANALRHGAGPLSVTARPAEKGRVLADFANPVADPAAIDADRLFERFYQADASRATQGSGLGLAVAAELAAAQGMGLSARVAGGTLTITLAMSAV